jgi:hypothetical protein
LTISLVAVGAVACVQGEIPSDDSVGQQLSGRVFYVATTGSDANDGSLARPWATIPHASTQVAAGDTVLVEDGTYRLGSGGFRGDIAIATSGAPGSRVVYRSQHRWGAKLIGGGTGDGSTVIGISGSYNIIQDFDVTGSDANGITLATAGTTTSYNQAIGNYVHDLVAPCDGNGGTAINSGGGDDYNPGVGHLDMIGNVVRNVTDPAGCSAPHGAGIFQAVPYGLVANNIIIHGGRWAIESWHAANHETYFGNVIINSGQSITMGAGDSPFLGNVNDYSIVQNNIVFNASATAIVETGSTGPHNQYIDNLVFGGNTTISLNNGLKAIGTVIADPMFINNDATAFGNYGLRSGSPAIGKGAVLAAVRTDYAGNAYPTSGATDIGAILFAPASGASDGGNTPVTDGGSAPVTDSGTIPRGGTLLVAAGISTSAAAITAGQSVTLTWTTRNAVEADLNGTAVALNGSTTVTPTATTTYRITGKGADGSTDWGQVTVTVSAATTGPVAAGISASATTISAGQSCVLTWTTRNAVSAVLNGASVPLSGTKTVSPSTTTTYRVTATGANEATDWGQVTISVR